MKFVRITAKTVEDAVQQGIAQLGITREAAIIHVVEEPSGGLFGLLRRKQAVVDVFDPAAEEETAEESAPAEEKADDPAAPAEKIETEAAPEVKAASEVKAEPAAEEEAEEQVPAATEEAALDAEQPEESAAPGKSTAGKEDFVFSEAEQSETAEAAKAFLQGVFQSMDLSVTMEKMTNRDRILLNLHGKGLGILIGKHGQTLNALQYLTNLAAGRLYHHRYFVMLDVENYRTRREQTLQSLAKRLADKVKRTGSPVELEPMDAGERRIIHLALQGHPAIETDSEGEGSARHVVIRLK